MQIAFLQTKLQKVANWKLQADNLVYDSLLTKVVERLEVLDSLSIAYAALRVNCLSM